MDSLSNETHTITLERSLQILVTYLETIYNQCSGSGASICEEHLWDYDLEEVITDEVVVGDGGQERRSRSRKRPIPVELRFPTPQGWRCVSLDRYESVFGLMDLNDLVSPGGLWKKQQKMEMAFAYLAVIDLYDWGYLDEDYNVFMLLPAQRSTRRHCPLPLSSGVSPPFSCTLPPYSDSINNTEPTSVIGSSIARVSSTDSNNTSNGSDSSVNTLAMAIKEYGNNVDRKKKEPVIIGQPPSIENATTLRDLSACNQIRTYRPQVGSYDSIPRTTYSKFSSTETVVTNTSDTVQDDDTIVSISTGTVGSICSVAWPHYGENDLYSRTAVVGCNSAHSGSICQISSDNDHSDSHDSRFDDCEDDDFF